MKKSKLSLFNKKAIRGICVGAAFTAAYTSAFLMEVNNSKKHFGESQQLKQNELVSYTTTESMIENNQEEKTSQKSPVIAILYHADQQISLVIGNQHFSIEAAREKYPEFTAEILEYVKETFPEKYQAWLELNQSAKDTTLEK
ncbi:MAG: hypothetical protein IKT33_02320 [Clostridia bacterium]|nr:hypothetical protein [Clostridia bacterium]